MTEFPQGAVRASGHSGAVPFVSVANMVSLVRHIGIETVLREIALYIEDDFRHWESFDKIPRVAAHSEGGVIELMPTSNDRLYGFKYVNGHPRNTRAGLQTVAAFGCLSDVVTGYPLMLSEMTFLTALRTGATSALVGRYLAPKGAQCMAVIGNGAQSEFQALAFRALCGINSVRLYDVNRDASEKCRINLQKFDFDVTICSSVEDAVQGAQIITTVTADKQRATILTDNLVGAGVHLNAVGGDCPGKTELHADILKRADVFVEFPPQTRIEGEIQQMPEDFPVTEFWKVVTGQAAGRTSVRQLTMFDSVGFATEDFSALRYVYDRIQRTSYFEMLDLVADPSQPIDLIGLVL